MDKLYSSNELMSMPTLRENDELKLKVEDEKVRYWFREERNLVIIEEYSTYTENWYISNRYLAEEELDIKVPKELTEDERENLIETWYLKGNENPWIAEAYDPEFDLASFYECKTVDELVLKMIHGNWSLGSSFYFRNMCFINQINGGDEWLVIRDGIAFESWSAGRTIESDGINAFKKQLEAMFEATEVQLLSLTYKESV